jgi:hypothetical protein
MRLFSSWWRIVKLSSWVLINSQSPSALVEEEDDKRRENEHAVVALRKGRLVEWIGMDRRGPPRGDMDDGTSQLVLFHVKRLFCVMCCLIRRFPFLFASSRALLATELGPETWTSGCPLWLFFGDDACVAFSRNPVFISPHRTAQT